MDFLLSHRMLQDTVHYIPQLLLNKLKFLTNYLKQVCPNKINNAFLIYLTNHYSSTLKIDSIKLDNNEISFKTLSKLLNIIQMKIIKTFKIKTKKILIRLMWRNDRKLDHMINSHFQSKLKISKHREIFQLHILCYKIQAEIQLICNQILKQENMKMMMGTFHLISLKLLIMSW